MNTGNSNKIRIAYVIPGTVISGGTAIILQHANRLIDRGYDVLLINTAGDGKIDWFKNKAVTVNGTELERSFLESIDIMVATHWTTASYVKKYALKRKIYFVQSDERRFNLSAKDIQKCERTYTESFEFMTEAKWIQRWLKEEYGHDTYYVPNGLDLDLFYADKPLEPKGKKVRVLLEGPSSIPFKGMASAFEAVKGLDCEVWYVSSEGKPKKEWRYDKFLRNVPIAKMRSVYSSCDIFLKMSRIEGFFGPPMEAMACGCAVVVGECTGFDEYIENGRNALVVDMGDTEGAQKAVKKLINDRSLREKLVKNGHETAKEWSWDRSIDLLEKMAKKEKPEVFYTADSPKRYDYKKEMRGVRYHGELIEYYSSPAIIGQKNRWIEHLEKDIKVLKDEIKRLENSPSYKIESKAKSAVKKVIRRK